MPLEINMGLKKCVWLKSVKDFLYMLQYVN